MGRRLPTLLLLAAALGVLAPSTVTAGPAPSATINVCDGAGSPNRLGVRVLMPGGRAADRMHASIEPQWWSRQRQQWLPAEGGGVELYLGRGNVRSRQDGFTFHYLPPLAAKPSAKGYAMRALVGFQWRRKGQVVRSASAVTGDGMRGVLESSPAGFSAAVCALR